MLTQYFWEGLWYHTLFRVLLGPSKLEMYSNLEIPELLSSLFGVSFRGRIVSVWAHLSIAITLVLGCWIACQTLHAGHIVAHTYLCCLQETSLKFLFFIPLLTQVWFCASDLSYRAACLLWLDPEPIVNIVQLKCKYFSNQLALLIITAKDREAWKLRWLLLFIPTSNLVN